LNLVGAAIVAALTLAASVGLLALVAIFIALVLVGLALRVFDAIRQVVLRSQRTKSLKQGSRHE
jgi:uncharacterized membrane protein